MSVLSFSAYQYKQQSTIAKDFTVFFKPTPTLESLFKENQDKEDITVVYFWQKHCLCDAYVLGHFYTLMNEYGPKGVQFYIADMSPNTTNVEQPLNIPALPRNKLLLIQKQITHTPSVAIWNKNQDLIYLGAHSTENICNADTSIIQKVLSTIEYNRSAYNTNTTASGCFCPI